MVIKQRAAGFSRIYYLRSNFSWWNNSWFCMYSGIIQFIILCIHSFCMYWIVFSIDCRAWISRRAQFIRIPSASIIDAVTISKVMGIWGKRKKRGANEKNGEFPTTNILNFFNYKTKDWCKKSDLRWVSRSRSLPPSHLDLFRICTDMTNISYLSGSGSTRTSGSSTPFQFTNFIYEETKRDLFNNYHF